MQERTVQPSAEGTHSSESSSAFPADLKESKVGVSKANIMAKDQPQRITLEDYSNSTAPQFFTSIVRPEVQAHNITYPHSLIQLIQGNLFHGLPNEDPYAHLVFIFFGWRSQEVAAFFQGKQLEDMGRGSREISKEVLPRIKDS